MPKQPKQPKQPGPRGGGDSKLRVVFLHPDLGLGGAEKLIVEAATALKEKGHDVKIYTSHYDRKRCFEGTKDLDVHVAGDFLPRSLFGQFHIVFALLRAIWLSFYACLHSGAQVFVTDQIAVYNICLRMLCSQPIVFYCHFPDQLLTQRPSFFKYLYRLPFDYLEELGTGVADSVLVNSEFTASVFRKTFRWLKNTRLEVVYPAIALPPLKSIQKRSRTGPSTFVSINRYERKKNIALVLHALAAIRNLLAKKDDQHGAKLVIAGGYDARVKENVEVYNELRTLAYDTYGFSEKQVTFMRSFSDSEKASLISTAAAVLYTPEGEHFGIVPIEAMAYQTPVIAINSGGPKETVEHKETGFLCSTDATEWARYMMELMKDPSKPDTMGKKGRKRVERLFSAEAFQSKFHKAVTTTEYRSSSWVCMHEWM
uniref:Alpha-1,3/1,6-mannosyltransferase ALG2 n=1 Tax=Lotharella globosa TaxID=91324 RepID=A0A7S3YVF8_9EUKA